MSSILRLLENLEEEWREPRRPSKDEFALTCRFDRTPPRGLNQISLPVPPDMLEFWSAFSTASLFVDVEHGQWGLEILSPLEALRETRLQRRLSPENFNRKSDLVVGRFLGDLDVLILLSEPRDANYGAVAASDAEYHRAEWPIVADSFGQFLERFSSHAGDKYWHRPDYRQLPRLARLKWGKP